VTFDKKSGLFWLQLCTINKNITLGGFSSKQELLSIKHLKDMMLGDYNPLCISPSFYPTKVRFYYITMPCLQCFVKHTVFFVTILQTAITFKQPK
jgi:hypothetical protein